MGNDVKFYDFDESSVGLTRGQVRDIVDVLARFEGKFVLHGYMRSDYRGYLGLHVSDMMTTLHEIYLDGAETRKVHAAGRSTGGERVAPDPQLAVAMVLAHELQHANQHHVHVTGGKGSKSFFGKKRSRYRTRACEREARMFADESLDALARILGREPKETVLTKQDDPAELVQIARSFLGAEDVGPADIAQELRASGLNNPANVARVRELIDWEAERFTS